MIYNHNITLVVPVTHLDIAKKINKHLDTDDVGGEDGFMQRVTKDSIEYAVYSRPCDEVYAASAALLVTVPSALFDMCQSDSRFEIKPTIEECEAFTDVAEAYIDSPLPVEYVDVVPANMENI